ncbi:type I restriction enzyme HsdR N-terminal domain-containing protein [Taibaiella lutea]|uniref:Type I restriction enzyme HsdR N-terminal domain-containing protein n=1 Tax=Taibaiella lutea TaxID=2608001 RepID=A0A5M6CIB3_9BACT|nr:type I restriction enzyme HsdR N-terminal domain-containing protein [Taibaiella lutea]KAA5534756.1 type I restriction enzyme HsdR N-terminal domain-containing protein [Taibaiella lutea]
MLHLIYPPHDFKIRQQENGRYIFDFIRKKYVMLTPEEWVRQHILVYLCEVMEYPKGLISVEKEIKINNLKKRYDIVVYDYDHKPWMLIECKEPDVPVSDITLQQLLRYHHVLQCPYWFLTNGANHFCAAVKDNTVKWLEAIPAHNS